MQPLQGQERLTEESLTERLVDLEQLEETRLHAAYGMKVEKLRQKKWFDRNLKNKDLKEGYLCLMYGVRNTKRKLKYQGMGPYQVVEITPQGAVRIATLDGVVMEGYINGSKLRRFYGPLTLHALQTIHSNQRRKKEEKLAQLQARQEAKEREVKEKFRRMTLYKAPLKTKT